MKKYILVFLFILLNYSILSAQTGWFVQKNTFPGTTVNLFFLNSNTGWILLDSGKIIKTTDGGTNWSSAYSILPQYPVYLIKFANPMTGWVAGGRYDPNPFSMEYAIIMKTTNGGINWVTQYTDSWGPRFNDLTIADENNVFGTSAGTDFTGMASWGKLIKTTNGGTNWFSDPTISGIAMTSVSFANSYTGWVSAYTQMDVPFTRRFIYKTTNTGTNWTIAYRDSIFAFTPVISRIHFPEINTGYKILGLLKKSTNGGSNWSNLDSANTYNLNEIFFVSSDTGWIIKSGIRRTNNGGLNWTVQSAPAAVNKLRFVNANTGWALGNNVLLKTTTGGITDTNYATYFPLHTGNFYLYYAWEWPNPGNLSYFKARITKDTIMNGHKYFYLLNFPDIGNGWVRYDSARTNLLFYFPNANCSGYTNDKIIDSLAAIPNNQVSSCVYHWSYTRCEDTATQMLFSSMRVKTKSFRHDGLMLAHTRYAKDIGIISYDYGEPPPSTYFVGLKGCFINGVLYGDTLVTSVKNISSEVPDSYSLSQNYPNPFNPSTTIRYDLPRAGVVKLAVYDVIGREIEMLVNERQMAGSYEATFDGSRFASGVYFYRLTTEGYRETRKMFLIR